MSTDSALAINQGPGDTSSSTATANEAAPAAVVNQPVAKPASWRALTISIIVLSAGLSSLTYGVNSITAVFLKEQLGISVNLASFLTNALLAVNFGSGIVGGLLADNLLSHIGNVAFGCCVLVAGLSILIGTSAASPAPASLLSSSSTFIANSSSTPTHSSGLMGAGLLALFVALFGAGSMRPSISAMLGDQFGKSDGKLRTSYFSWMYFAAQAGSLVTQFTFPIVLQQTRPWVVFVLSLISFVLPAAIFFIARHILSLRAASLGVAVDGDSATVNGGGCCLRPSGASGKRKKSSITLLFSRKMLRVILIFLPLSFFWGVYFQASSIWVFQASRMRRGLGSWQIPYAEVGAINALFDVIFIPILERFVYPTFERVTGRHLKALPRMMLGFFFSGLATGTAGFVQLAMEARGNAGKAGLTIAWIIPQYLFVSIAEVVLAPTAYDFAYTQAPGDTKGLVSALWLLTIALGNGVTALLGLLPIKNASAMSFVIAGISFAFSVLFIFFTCTYKYAEEEEEAASKPLLSSEPAKPKT